MDKAYDTVQRDNYTTFTYGTLDLQVRLLGAAENAGRATDHLRGTLMTSAYGVIDALNELIEARDDVSETGPTRYMAEKEVTANELTVHLSVSVYLNTKAPVKLIAGLVESILDDGTLCALAVLEPQEKPKDTLRDIIDTMVSEVSTFMTKK